MKQPTAEIIINKAIELGKSLGYIDVIKLADSFGIHIYPDGRYFEKNNEFQACIVYDKKTQRYEIFVNPAQPLERQRFSIAHELAHYVLHNGKLQSKGILNKDPLDIASRQEDDQADDLAAKILMPQKLVNEFMMNENVEINKL